MKRKFEEHRFNTENSSIIETVNDVIDHYKNLGFVLTLRQLYYQMIGSDLFPDSWIDTLLGTKNTQKNYKRFGNLVSDGRLAGLIDWEMIEDRGRVAQYPSHWTSPKEIVEAAASQFRIDRWAGQPNYVEVMVEKDALSGVLGPVCSQWDVHFSANKGYSSSSAMYEAGRRIKRALTLTSANTAHIIYLGDHDPSGLDMTRDIEERLAKFAQLEEDDFFSIHRIALNMPQVRKWKLPENPAKETDSRFAAYMEEHGDKSWELDAVEAQTLARLLEDQIKELIEDEEAWDQTYQQQQDMRAELQAFADNYGKKKTRKK